MIPVPEYIKDFMGEEFRSIQGVSASFNLRDYAKQCFENPVDNRAGCYIISATKRKFRYANGLKSPVLYIGLADDLYRRLHDDHWMKHLKPLIDNPDKGITSARVFQIEDKYQYMLYCGAHVDVFYNAGNRDEKEFESQLIGSFYCKYRSTPVGNAARSFSKK